MEIKDGKIQLTFPVTLRVEFGLPRGFDMSCVARVYLVVDGQAITLVRGVRLQQFSPGDSLNIEIPDHLDVEFV